MKSPGIVWSSHWVGVPELGDQEKTTGVIVAALVLDGAGGRATKRRVGRAGLGGVGRGVRNQCRA